MCDPFIISITTKNVQTITVQGLCYCPHGLRNFTLSCSSKMTEDSTCGSGTVPQLFKIGSGNNVAQQLYEKGTPFRLLNPSTLLVNDEWKTHRNISGPYLGFATKDIVDCRNLARSCSNATAGKCSDQLENSSGAMLNWVLQKIIPSN